MSELLSRWLQFLSKWAEIDPTPPPNPDPSPIPTPPPPIPKPPVKPPGVVDAINSARVLAGLPVLVDDPALDHSAESRAIAMASGDGLDHGDFAGRIAAVYPNTAAGEDIAEGQRDAASVVDAWMDDPPHRANILGAFDRVGAGSARDATGAVYWCADFDQTG